MGRTRQLERELTPRQRQVLDLLARGHTNAEIGERLGITLAGAKWHVSELLMKLDANTREELAERWLRDRRPAQRLRRWFGAIAAFSPLKLSAASVAGAVAAVAGVGVAVGVIALRDGDESGPNVVVAVVADPPTPASTPVPVATLPAAPGAVWTSTEALRHAEDVANSQIAKYAVLLARVPDVTQMRLTHATWNPGISHYDSPNGDNYWDRSDGARSAWAFYWVLDSVEAAPNVSFRRAPLEVEVLIEDGKEMLAGRVLLVDSDIGGHGGDGFVSRMDEERRKQERDARLPAGPDVPMGWHNDVADGSPLVAYPANAGYWCIVGRNSDGTVGAGGWCAPDADPRTAPLTANLSTTFTAGGVMGDVGFFVTTDPAIVRLRVLPGDGRDLSFSTYAAPTQSAISRRFAWLDVGRVAPEGYTLIGYDAAGAEVSREGREPPLPPPTRSP
jgi:DNA-binding CsgD family transcriptional regulator